MALRSPLASVSAHPGSMNDEELSHHRPPWQSSTSTQTQMRHPRSAPVSSEQALEPDDASCPKALEKHLQALMEEDAILDYPVVDFIEAVFGMRPEYIQSGPEPYFLHEDARRYIVYKYDRRTQLCGDRTAQLYFAKVLLSLSQQLEGRVILNKQLLQANGCRIVEMNDVNFPGNSALNPGFMYSWHPMKEKWKWNYVGACGELTKTRFGSVEEARALDLTIDLQKIPPSTHVSAPRIGKKRKALITTEDSRIRKRLRLDGQDISTKRASFSSKQFKIISHLHEAICHGVRSYATGFLIEDRTMSLWYLDHMGLVKSADFDFLRLPHLLLLYVAAIKYATPRQLGFFDLLDFSPDMAASTLKAFRGVNLCFPTALDINDRVLRDLRFAVDVSGRRHVIPPHGSIGRCTTIVPVKAAPTSQVAQDLCEDEKLVAKISWHSPRQVGEDAYIRMARVTLARKEATCKYLKHVVDMKCSLTRTIEKMGLPRAFMHGLPEDDAVERVCRVLILEEYLPLTEVNSSEEFMTAFVGALRGHHAVYKSTHILHRDVSIDNIMFHGVSNGRTQKVVGVMCDWDLAKKLEAADIAIDNIVKDTVKSMIPPDTTAATTSGEQPERQNFRAGTVPFMALDLLTCDQVPQQLYRHDLESFFYVLVWFIAKYNPKTRTLGRIEEWLKGTFKDVGESKAEAVRNMLPVKTLMAGGHKDYQIFTAGAMKILRRLVSPILRANTRLRETIVDALMDLFETMKEFESLPVEQKVALVYGEIYQDVVSREEIMSYSAFMDCLGVPAEEM